LSKGDPRPVCLVTGAARRIGAAIATRLAGSFDVAIHYNRSRGEADELARALERKGGRARAFHADLADPDNAAELVEEVSAALGPIDLLVANASSFENDTPSTFDPQHMRRLLDVNLVAPLALAQAFARHGTPRATFVTLLDNKVFALNPDFFSYSLGKVALHGAIDMLALHYRGRMRVCGVAPSVTLVSGDQSEDNFERSWRHTLTGAGPTLDDIASAIEFIWSTKSINGETIVLDGGQRLMSLERDVAFVVE
jgi:NAD(P)-dependent dehydrogenase (short-subunit alcohol dehydrogenase family)